MKFGLVLFVAVICPMICWKSLRYASFLQRVSIACYAKRCISYRKSVRPSVRPSVRLSDAGTVSKRFDLSENTRRCFNWDATAQTLILSSFYWGYLSTMLSGAMLSVKCDGKWLLIIAVSLTSILCIVTPHLTNVGGLAAMITLRVVAGIFWMWKPLGFGVPNFQYSSPRSYSFLKMPKELLK